MRYLTSWSFHCLLSKQTCWAHGREVPGRQSPWWAPRSPFPAHVSQSLPVMASSSLKWGPPCQAACLTKGCGVRPQLAYSTGLLASRQETQRRDRMSSPGLDSEVHSPQPPADQERRRMPSAALLPKLGERRTDGGSGQCSLHKDSS